MIPAADRLMDAARTALDAAVPADPVDDTDIDAEITAGCRHAEGRVAHDGQCIDPGLEERDR